MRALRRAILGVLALALLAIAGIAVVPPGAPEPATVDWSEHAGGPVDSLEVAWVGHSLMNARDPQVNDAENVLEMVARFARGSGLEHEGVDHTLFGAPLSLLWRGSPHSYTRDEPEMADKRAALFDRDLDAIVLTEGIPVGLSMQREHSSYYLQRFYCSFLRKNPEGRVYLYESWVHLQGSDPDADYLPAHQWTWTDQLEFAREEWDRLADEAMTGDVVGPRVRDRFERWLGEGEGQCASSGPIYLVPVATAMRTLGELLEQQPPGWTYRGEPLTTASLMANPYASWPDDWPTEDPLDDATVQAALDALPKAHPDEELDDVHPSDLGVYVASLVSFATLHRRSPVGLPTIEGLPEESARGIQDLVWGVVREEPRTGVR